MTTTYGIISDLHRADPRIVPAAINILKQEGAQKLVFNGDLVGDKFPNVDEQNYLAFLLECAGSSNLETYVQPGSHDEFVQFHPVVKELQKHFPNIMDVFDNQKISAADHDLAFLPGSDWRAGKAASGGYDLKRIDMVETGLYRKGKGIIHLTNMNDLKKYVTHPEKTVVFCHVSAKFESVENAVDMAYFAEKKNGALEPGVVVEGRIRQQVGKSISYEVVQQIAKDNGYTLKRENRGNQDLANLFKELNIKKAINGHFHESVHRANDLQSRAVEEAIYTDELFWNASYGDAGKFGLLTVDGNKVAYENIDIRNYR